MNRVGNERHSSSYVPPRAGMHRARSKSDLTINELGIKKTHFFSSFIQKINEMDKDLAEIKARYLPQPSPRIPIDATNEKIAYLKVKLDKFNSKSWVCEPSLIATLERTQNLLIDFYSDQEFKSILKAQIEYVNDSLLKGVIRYEDPKTKKGSDLINYVNVVAISETGQRLLAADKELFLKFSNVHILSLSKKISLLYPREEKHESFFAELIQAIHSIHERKVEVKPEEIGNLLQNLNELNTEVQKNFDTSGDHIRTELSSLLKPDPGQDFSYSNVYPVSLFEDFGLVDEPSKETQRFYLNKILNEIVKTEEEFSKNIGLIAEAPLFTALVKEGVITMEEMADLRRGWKKLHSSSEQLAAQLKQKDSCLRDKFESFLAAFTPPFIDEQMENCKVLMCHFMEGNKILHKIKANVKGQQMLMGFSAINRLDLFDIWIMPIQRPPRYILLIKEVKKMVSIEAVEKRLDYVEKWVKAINFFAPDFSK